MNGRPATEMSLHTHAWRTRVAGYVRYEGLPPLSPPSLSLSLYALSTWLCARVPRTLEVVGVRCALRVGTDEPTWGHRESGYYRQTLIWPRPGLPSNFRALTRPLTRLSVNAPKRRDAFSTPAFYRHGEQLRVVLQPWYSRRLRT